MGKKFKIKNKDKENPNFKVGNNCGIRALKLHTSQKVSLSVLKSLLQIAYLFFIAQ